MRTKDATGRNGKKRQQNAEDADTRQNEMRGQKEERRQEMNKRRGGDSQDANTQDGRTEKSAEKKRTTPRTDSLEK